MSHVAVLASDGYSELEFWYPVLRCREAGYEVSVVATAVDGVYRSRLGYPVIPDAALDQVQPDVLVLPSSTSVDLLAQDEALLTAVREVSSAGGRVVAVGNGGDLAAAAGIAVGDHLVSFADADALIGLVAGIGGTSGQDLSGHRVVVLAESQYQELELWYPVLRLRETGADVVVAAPQAHALYSSKIGVPVYSDVTVDEIDADVVDALVVPGGFAPEAMRRSTALLSLVKSVHDSGAIVAAICHAGWVLVSSGIAPGRKLTCVPIIRDDLLSAGAEYVDEPVVRDGNLITSRLPNDLPDFCAELVRALEDAGPPRGNGAGRWPSVEGRRSHATFDRPAALIQAPAGPGSANYRTTSVLADI